MLSSIFSKIVCNLLYVCIDTQDKLSNLYFRIFDNSVVSIKAYSEHKSYVLYHLIFSPLYPIRTFKCNDIIYEDNVLLEVVHNKAKTTFTTILPAKDIITLSSKQFEQNITGIDESKVDILSFTLNQVPFIHLFNKIYHSFQKYNIETNQFAMYCVQKYKVLIDPPYSIEMIDNDFNEQTFKENDTIKINKFHEQ